MSLRNSLALLLLLLLPCRADESAARRLFILHTNDIHGHIEAYDRGGLERLAYLIRQYRMLYPGEVVLLDAGDTSLGTPLSGIFHGRPTAELMDYLDYDAVAVGNHEFNWGKEKMEELTSRMATAVLCANLVRADGGEPPFPPSTVIERNGVRLGVIGLVAPDTSRRAPARATEGWNFLAPADAARAALATLPEVDAVLSLTHLGMEADKELAEQVPELDLIVGGHSHTAVRIPVYRGSTPIVQADCYARHLGVLEVRVDRENDTLEVVNYSLVSALAAPAVDDEAHRIVESYAAELRPLLEKEVAAVTDLISKRPAKDSFDTPLGNLISDVFRHQAGTDIAFYNRGGVRFDMPAGPLTVEGVHKLFPFDDPVTVLEATGREVRAVVEQGTVDGEGPLSPSGLTATIVDGRVEDIRVAGEPLQDDAVYTVATTAFLAGGGDGMGALSGLRVVKALDYTRDVLLQYLESHSRLEPPETGRFRVSPSRIRGVSPERHRTMEDQ